MSNTNGNQPASDSDDRLTEAGKREALDDDSGSSTPNGQATETVRPEVSARIPKRIGQYHIKRAIASGGMGTVYEAMQERPRRTVALKLMRQGIASRSALRRFDYESQILARLRHPGIAQVYEAGTHRDPGAPGATVPFFAMEYIVGAKPITQYVKEKKLGTRQRMELFAPVCDAIHHGHQKGIIHRDLKPSNILVDATGQVKIIDFGVARSTDSDLAVTTLQTDIGQLIGTLQYMSPEQCEADPHNIDTRSDVYALGVVFYEVLCGRLPYDVTRMAMHEATRIICEHQPSKLTTVDKTLKGDIETIALKAVEKDRERRYQSATDFGQDIRRYLNNEAITARPPSIVYQLHIFARRNRGLLSAVAAVFLALLIGVIVSTFQWVKAERYAREAVEARRVAEEARDAESRQRGLADQRYEEIIRLADLKRLADARSAADALWPAHPEKIAAMEAWITAQGAPLRDNLPEHEATLASLRSQALEYDPEQQRQDRETHPKAAELAEQKQHLAGLQKELHNARAEEGEDAEEKTRRIEEYEKTIGEAEQSIAELEEAVKERRTWKFTDAQTQWQHDTLGGLVQGLREFVDPDPKKGILASVEERLEFASRIEQQSTTGEQAATRWAEAVADIGQLEVYGGLQLAPQLGLLPLRRDPRSGLWEFWHIQTGTKPELNADAEAVNPWVLTGDTGLVFVLIPGGTFWMGAQKHDPERRNYDPHATARESPVHEMTLAAFLISKYEMTQGQWQRFTGANPSRYGPTWSWKGEPPAETPIHQNQRWNPVEQVTWMECRNVLDRLGLVLPTEAQWEYAARAGTASVWWTGDEKESIGVERAGNLADGWTKSKGGPRGWPYEEWLEDGWVGHAPVGSFRPNGFGLHDTIGNVWEWCRDWFAEYDAEVQPGDGLRKVTGARIRMYRGGSYLDAAAFERSATRYFSTPEFHANNLGVRPARVITE
jgi:serine/threonine protein kinase/formylglycine-generating enzyme required for sulfatase activity